ncbi:glycosyltransferase family 2 protein [Nitratireductor sp. ZSWI3]|uniref:glycosyltransferase family 2 protein n=1 Tax=Nitratireductor sp. ZSWI3 TaxID=2966359 RepID=UPI0021505606|nr:hypothetical protein [Nitratireductor sp. ZSWI3]MCR4266993.1 hypothetical protein [Nitratireductor sp. ZSWI3]
MLDTKRDNAATQPPEAGPVARARTMRPGKVVACPIDDTLLLLLGSGGPMPDEVAVEFNDRAETRTAAAPLTWHLSAPLASDTHGFAIPVPTSARQGPLTTMRIVHGTQQGRRYVFAARAAGFTDAAGILAELAGGDLAVILDRLTDKLTQGPLTPGKLAAVTAFLQAGVPVEGRLELIGETHGPDLFLQGWEREAEPGLSRAFVCGATPAVAECALAAYARPDVPKGASGIIGLLTGSTPLKARDIKGLLLQRSSGWRYLAMHDARSICGPLETPGHIRSLVLDTRGTPDVLLRLRSAANRFDGTETVSSLPLPVRMGIDAAFDTGEALLVSGWMLDPDRHVEAVKLRGQGADARLDEHWTRLDRRDVSDAFAGEPRFAGALDQAHHLHGFVGFAKKTDALPASPLHIELTLRDTRRAHLPLTPTRLPAHTAALRQIRAVDARDWALSDVIDRQIIPLLAASTKSSPQVTDVVDYGAFRRATGPAIIIGVGENEEQDIVALLGLLALDGRTRRAPIVLAVPAERASRMAARLERLTRFYDLPLRLVSAEGASDVYDLFEAGAGAVSCEAVVLLSAALLPRDANWYARLVAAHGQAQDSIIAPTLVYEDHSVRWAGSWVAAQGAGRPLAGRYTGYPVSAVTALKITPIAAAAPECCILPREALFRVGGFSHGYLGSHEKGLDFGLKLARDGVPSYWFPSVQVLGSGEASGAANGAAAALVERIDRKIFDTRWASVLLDDEASSAQVRA